jgi:2-keto-4-pentenoate hydratase/2-oxohepta-3-ene-1,7-dioic acid hydratase in catechol pathway
MFSPADRHLERGWPGRVDGDRVVQLAAQTLQAFFTGGGHAREHAEYRLDEVVFLPPVLHPPSVRIFDGETFRFANPAAIVAADAEVAVPEGATALVPVPRRAAVVGAEGAIGGFTQLVEWTAPELPGEKSRDFALALGPFVTTPDEGAPPGADWERLVAHAAANTRLVPGDVIAV